tara:strand:- start:639 stop:1553 length:915 start_codon:yes stop_codon:yes gene_type:complete
MSLHNTYKENLMSRNGYGPYQSEWQEKAKAWFQTLRDEICEGLEALENECDLSQDIAPQAFTRKSWQRKQNPDGSDGGGGVMSILRDGRAFEKAGVNISTVHGSFSESFRGQIPGTQDSGDFWASGLSLVIHPRNPHVPPIHMNTRHIVTEKAWFGGGIDLNPIAANDEDTEFFKSKLAETCARHNPGYYADFAKWCDDYFYLPHRDEHRGIGGIFYDYLNSGSWQDDFEYTKDVGRSFIKIYGEIVRRHMNTPWSEDEREHQLFRRGRYAEFNLLYDRGTVFGLKTGGNTEAILMSLPPLAKW